ncbi:hypothetical protein OKA04_23430 [Luteolibacter flavescens]|uniref:Uncharacterized protein n=1 Tax=Luteolibacter flavescens TaxID=1859460 RepID=A0ABT3FVW2_9BACT|nr:hypothetical protein [Luteolibacter flavescens]MCW1887709.1 hypothetical protein [Luteolibacter flavescens]
MIQITIDAAGLGLTIDQLAAATADKESLHLAAAAAVEFAWDAHLEAHYKPKDEGQLDYWADVQRSLESTSSAEAGMVRVTQDFIELYYYGGTTTPGKSISSWTGKLTRALAKPSERVPVVDGRRIAPGRFREDHAELAFIRAMEGDVIGYLFEAIEDGLISRGRNKGKPRLRRAGPLMYTLMSRYTYPPDPGIIPPDAELSAAARQAVLDFLEVDT